MLAKPTRLFYTDSANTPLGTYLAGSSPQPNAFTPFGLPPPAYTHALGLAAQPLGGPGGLYLLGSRGYAPASLRFLNPDPLFLAREEGLNSYAYGTADPITFSGLSAQVPG
ncbi:RHS repeat-associated core domain-containing protein [Pseudomonas sp. NPDC007930]|uniref:RHS repeat-associated core domain-containing protein n=1 Tax=Pseudomonas sp. NPDC007930 TaxID=3364417 RepID=UPI0036ED4FBD